MPSSIASSFNSKSIKSSEINKKHNEIRTLARTTRPQDNMHTSPEMAAVLNKFQDVTDEHSTCLICGNAMPNTFIHLSTCKKHLACEKCTPEDKAGRTLCTRGGEAGPKKCPFEGCGGELLEKPYVDHLLTKLVRATRGLGTELFHAASCDVTRAEANADNRPATTTADESDDDSEETAVDRKAEAREKKKQTTLTNQRLDLIHAVLEEAQIKLNISLDEMSSEEEKKVLKLASTRQTRAATNQDRKKAQVLENFLARNPERLAEIAHIMPPPLEA